MFAAPAPARRGAYMGRKRWAQPFDRFLLIEHQSGVEAEYFLNQLSF
jgi:hypothetical protein